MPKHCIAGFANKLSTQRCQGASKVLNGSPSALLERWCLVEVFFTRLQLAYEVWVLKPKLMDTLVACLPVHETATVFLDVVQVQGDGDAVVPGTVHMIPKR